MTNRIGNPSVSVVIPIYNMESLLGRCIDSILAQTYPCCQIILVDDGSRDKTLEICREYEKRYPVIQVIAKENGGVSTARNAGLKQTSGEWIMFVDPDDRLEPAIVETLLQAVDEHTDVAACCCVAEYEGQREKVSFFAGDTVFADEKDSVAAPDGFARSTKKPLYLELMDKDYACESNEGRRRITAIGVPWGKLYRASLLKDNDLTFDPDLKRMQDNIFNMYVFEKAEQIRYIDEPLYIYNMNHLEASSVRFDQRAPQFFGKVLKVRDGFCRSRGFVRDEEMDRCRHTEVILLTNMMLIRYFLHAQYPRSRKEQKKEMAAFFGEEMYREAFREKNRKSLAWSNTLRIWLLKNRWLDALILVERLYRKVQKAA